jgi:hypothetical protein
VARKLLLVLVFFGPVAVDIGANLFSRSQFWPPLLPGLYYGGIVIAGLEFGWRTGLGVALLGAISRSLIARFLYRSPFTQVEAQLLAFLIVGFAFLEERRRTRDRGNYILLAADRQNGHARIQLRVLGQTVRGSDPAAGRGAYSSTFDAPGGMRVLAARRTVLQHGGTITLDQTGSLKKLISLSLPLYHGQEP